MMKVYGRSDSSNSAKVYWLLDEIGMEYERIDCGGRFGGNDEPAYLAMNPHGKVPTVVDGDLVVWESNAVLRYIASQYRAVELWPDTPSGRATVDKWMDWSATALTPPLTRLRKTMKAGGDGIDAMTATVIGAFAQLDAKLGLTQHMAGNAFTIADIAAGPAVHRWFLLPVDKPDLTNLNAYYERLRARPAFASRIVGAVS